MGVSGAIVDVSGEAVRVSGESIVVTSGQVRALMSGDRVIVTLSGDVIPIPVGGDAIGSGLIAGGLYGFNGTTWDRIRAQVADGLTTGILNVGLMGTPDAISWVMLRANTPVDAQGGNAGTVFVQSFSRGYNGTNWDLLRTSQGSSGVTTGILATHTVGYTPTLVSGAVFVNVKSGAAYLYSININRYASGQQFEIRDSTSGIVGTILGTITPDTSLIAPTTLKYNCLVTSGIVISTSGTTWDLTVNWRAA